MASATDDDPALDLLRGKYSELTRKYAQLVERFDRRTTQDLAVYQLGVFGLRTSDAALALVGSGQIQVSNARFFQLTRSIRGSLEAIDSAGPLYPDLRTLVLAESDRMLRGREPAADLRYRDTRSEALIAIRLERSPDALQRVVLVVAEDVTEHARRDQELSRTREALLRRKRLRVLGELAASIAHDLGNTLRGASFQVAALRDPALPHGQREELVNAVSQRIEVASEAIAQLHDFAQTGTLGVSAVRLDRVAARAAALVGTDFHTSAAPVNIQIAIPELHAVPGSAAELSLLFLNLLRNARDAMPEGGTVTIAARRAKGCVAVTVADEGTGISAEVQRRLFDPFFTTKGTRGTGLGLWLARGPMQRLGGTIRAANRPRRGALFVLKFPLHDHDRAGRSPAEHRDGAPRAPSRPAPRRRRRARRNGRRT